MTYLAYESPSFPAMLSAVFSLTALGPPAIKAFSMLLLYSDTQSTVAEFPSSTKRTIVLFFPAKGPAASASGKLFPVAKMDPFAAMPWPVSNLAISMLVSYRVSPFRRLTFDMPACSSWASTCSGTALVPPRMMALVKQCRLIDSRSAPVSPDSGELNMMGILKCWA